MSAYRVSSIEEQRLRACLCDVLTLSSCLAAWLEHPSQALAGDVGDLLLRMVPADRIHVRLKDPASAKFRTTSRDARSVPAAEARMGSAVARPMPAGTGAPAMRMAIVPIGPGGELGELAVISAATDFPSDIDALFLRVASNLIATTLVHADLLARTSAEQRRFSDLVAVASHELRTPLHGIVGYLELLELGIPGPLTEAQRSHLGRIRHASQYLLRLVDHLLTSRTLEADRLAMHTAEVPVREMLDELGELLRPQVAAKRLHFSAAAPDDLRVRTDPDRLRQIILNLLSNAIKFTEPGGEVSIQCSSAPSVVRFHIRDTGQGIPPESIEAAFQPYVQVGRDLPGRPAEGVGLGLAISRELAATLGGRIEVESEPDRGSVFTLVLARG